MNTEHPLTKQYDPNKDVVKATIWSNRQKAKIAEINPQTLQPIHRTY